MISSKSLSAVNDGPAGYVAPERLYLTADGNVVGQGDPARLTLLAAKGATIPEARARELGLYEVAHEVAPDVMEVLTLAALAPAGAGPPADPPKGNAKAVKGPPANKAVAGPTEMKAEGKTD